jgi:hypothetical protein
VAVVLAVIYRWGAYYGNEVIVYTQEEAEHEVSIWINIFREQ